MHLYLQFCSWSEFEEELNMLAQHWLKSVLSLVSSKSSSVSRVCWEHSTEVPTKVSRSQTTSASTNAVISGTLLSWQASSV